MKRNNVVILDGVLAAIRQESSVIDGLEMAYVSGILSTTSPSTHEKIKHPFVVYRQRQALETRAFTEVVSGDLPVRLYGWLQSCWDGDSCRSVVVVENITFDVSPKLRAEATRVLVDAMKGVISRERDRTSPNDISISFGISTNAVLLSGTCTVRGEGEECRSATLRTDQEELGGNHLVAFHGSLLDPIRAFKKATRNRCVVSVGGWLHQVWSGGEHKETRVIAHRINFHHDANTVELARTFMLANPAHQGDARWQQQE
ncbi:MAG: hypothetical protein H8D34_03515 [Chloroflexi bacterium]|nr:hypothetical protein [Chloroflexota bacterium]MBL7164205.1 hypothetical protein [Anaerolineales bacterium]